MPWPKGRPQAIRQTGCADCGAAIEAVGYGVALCRPCAAQRKKAASLRYRRAHPTLPEVSREQSARTIAGAIEAGRSISATQREGVAWLPNEEIDLRWIVRVAVPFTYGMSKNRMLNWTKSQKPHLAAEFRGMRDALRDHFALSFAGPDAPKIVQAKLWLDIFVQKPDNRGDAVNVVDLVCDAVKAAIGLDDRWYSIRRLDWQITKADPMLYVGIG